MKNHKILFLTIPCSLVLLCYHLLPITDNLPANAVHPCRQIAGNFTMFITEIKKTSVMELIALFDYMHWGHSFVFQAINKFGAVGWQFFIERCYYCVKVRTVGHYCGFYALVQCFWQV